MTLAVPVPAQVAPGEFDTGALWNANVFNGLTYLLNPPMAFLYQATAQSIANATFVPLTWDSELSDTYGGHSTVTNTSEYTAQVGGTYLVMGSVGFVENSSGIRLVCIGKNGSYTTLYGVVDAVTTNSVTNGYASTAGLVTLNAGDYIQLNGYQTSGNTGGLATATGWQCSSLSVLWVHA